MSDKIQIGFDLVQAGFRLGDEMQRKKQERHAVVWGKMNIENARCFTQASGTFGHFFPEVSEVLRLPRKHEPEAVSATQDDDTRTSTKSKMTIVSHNEAVGTFKASRKFTKIAPAMKHDRRNPRLPTF